MTFLIDTVAQISVLNKYRAEKLGIKPSRKAINIMGETDVAETFPLPPTQLWLPGEKRMIAVEVAVKVLISEDLTY